MSSNQCSSSQNTVAAKLALQSIYILCKESVIDIREDNLVCYRYSLLFETCVFISLIIKVNEVEWKTEQKSYLQY